MVSLDGVGSEQRNTRPAIIVQNDVGNAHSLCEQLRVVDKSRLGRRVGKITDESVMTDITRKIKVVCGC